MRSTVLRVLFVILLFVIQSVHSGDGDVREADLIYDYIVVGLGQGGSTAAARLAEDGRYKVLGIEWGDRTHRLLGGKDFVAADFSYDSNGKIVVDYPPFTRFDVPQFGNSITTPPTPYPELTAIFNGEEKTVHVGKLLGGSAAHNGLIWNRHTRDTVNSWGVNEWSYNDMLPFYKKSENVTASTQRNAPQYHGLNGPIQISDTPTNQYYTAVPLLLQSCQNLGYPFNPDFNGASRYGCGQQVFSIGGGERYSAARAYLPKALKTGRLDIELNARATKILIRAGILSDPVAYGVEYYQDGIKKQVFAKKEIIIALSAVLTPKLLMLSGIGPAADLQKFGIKVWVNNPNVGKNLQSNQIGLGAWTYPTANYGNAMNVGAIQLEYSFNKTGPYAHAGQYAYAYMCSNGSTGARCTDPDTMIGFAAGGYWGSPSSTQKTLTTQVSVATPKGRSSVRLLSSDPFDCVNVTQNTYENPADLKAQIYGWREIRRLLRTFPASTIAGEELAPGAEKLTDAQLTAWIKANTFASTHWVGSAKFGNDNDPTRVVDTHLRVVGIKGLRIGDGSIFPSVNTHLQASVSVAGERVADFILKGQ